MRKLIAVSQTTHHKLKTLANKMTEARGTFTSIRAVVGALAADAQLEQLRKTIDARAGYMKLGKLKRMQAELSRMEKELGGIIYGE